MGPPIPLDPLSHVHCKAIISISAALPCRKGAALPNPVQILFESCPKENCQWTDESCPLIPEIEGLSYFRPKAGLLLLIAGLFILIECPPIRISIIIIFIFTNVLTSISPCKCPLSMSQSLFYISFIKWSIRPIISPNSFYHIKFKIPLVFDRINPCKFPLPCKKYMI